MGPITDKETSSSPAEDASTQQDGGGGLTTGGTSDSVVEIGVEREETSGDGAGVDPPRKELTLAELTMQCLATTIVGGLVCALMLALFGVVVYVMFIAPSKWAADNSCSPPYAALAQNHINQIHATRFIEIPGWQLYDKESGPVLMGYFRSELTCATGSNWTFHVELKCNGGEHTITQMRTYEAPGCSSQQFLFHLSDRDGLQCDFDSAAQWLIELRAKIPFGDCADEPAAVMDSITLYPITIAVSATGG